MSISKICSRCGKRIPTGTTCECVKRANRERHKSYNKNQRDQKANGFYSSSAWQKCRKKIIDMDGCDVYLYMTKGVMVPADMVHHIVPLKDDWNLRMNTNNLMSLSSATHNMIESRYDDDKPGMIRELSKMLAEFREDRGASKSF